MKHTKFKQVAGVQYPLFKRHNSYQQLHLLQQGEYGHNPQVKASDDDAASLTSSCLTDDGSGSCGGILGLGRLVDVAFLGEDGDRVGPAEPGGRIKGDPGCYGGSVINALGLGVSWRPMRRGFLFVVTFIVDT
jgi:hypothetical protein